MRPSCRLPRLILTACLVQVQTFGSCKRICRRNSTNASQTRLNTGTNALTEALLERRAHVAGRTQTEAALLSSQPGTGETTCGFALLDRATDKRSLTSLTTHILRVEVVGFAQQTLRLAEPLLREGCVGLTSLLKFSLLCLHLSGHTSADETGGEEGRRDFLQTSGGSR